MLGAPAVRGSVRDHRAPSHLGTRQRRARRSALLRARAARALPWPRSWRQAQRPRRRRTRLARTTKPRSRRRSLSPDALRRISRRPRPPLGDARTVRPRTRYARDRRVLGRRGVRGDCLPRRGSERRRERAKTTGPWPRSPARRWGSASPRGPSLSSRANTARSCRPRRSCTASSKDSRADFERAGFRFVASSDALRNPGGAHTLNGVDAAMRGKTDRFALVFEKPAP